MKRLTRKQQMQKDFRSLRLVAKGYHSPYIAFRLGMKYPYRSEMYFAAVRAEQGEAIKFDLSLRLELYKRDKKMTPLCFVV